MRRSLRSWLWRVPLEAEVDEEIAFHVEMRTRDLVANGMDESTARAIALKHVGDAARLKRTCVEIGRKRDREMRITQRLEEFGSDVRFAIRQLKASPGFTLVAALTLALGIGANSAIFALVDAALLRPLPLPDADRVVVLWERTERSQRGAVAPLNMLDWNDRSRTFDLIAGLRPAVGSMVMAGADGTAETVPRQWVTAGVFEVLGVRPIVGRTFQQTDDEQRARAVVLSEAFWRSRFSADPTVVGRSIRLDGSPYTVLGVVPNEAQLIGRTSIWALISIGHRNRGLRTAYGFHAIGRLKPDISLDAANADLAAVADGLAQELPDTNKGRSVAAEPLRDVLIGGDLRRTSMLFLGVVAVVLLICCANVANLLMARATVRARELAVRSALGAGRVRIIRQLLTESLVLSTFGAALGLAVGALILNTAPSVIPEGLLPGAVTPTFDIRVLTFCAAAALLVGLLFGLAPAWQATGFSLPSVIAGGGRTTTVSGGGIRRVLVAGEVATAVLLLVGAGLLLRTLNAVAQVDRGYRAESILTMVVDPLGSRYPTDAALLQFFEAVEQEVMAVPGVKSVGFASTLPLGTSYWGQSSFEIVGDPPAPESKRPAADYQIVSPTYFQTLDLPLVAGRGFTKDDTRERVPVCIVNEAFVRGYLRGRSPIGVRVALHDTAAANTPPVVREIVGVARQVKGRPDEVEDLLQIYVPLAQELSGDIFLVVSPSSGRADALAGSVRAAIGRIDTDQLVSVRNVMTLEDVAWGATARHRFRAVLVTTFAGLALLLAMIGVFGMLAYSVQQRVREFGLRRVLGATGRDVLRIVLQSAVGVVATGAIAGLFLSMILSRLLTTMLFGVQPLDPLTFASVTIVLVLTATMSIAGPAWRASRIDPAAALRNE